MDRIPPIVPRVRKLEREMIQQKVLMRYLLTITALVVIYLLKRTL